ncbi:uncharacterized protein LOC142242562 [Haematobia irritans]|uniref:uncharacterized protein LOC142242562 n=1 Tax=Haematobia irritans TaxID=7368 RepID=UPI003F5010A4
MLEEIIVVSTNGNKSDITNYRGIAKLSAIPKLMENIISDILVHQVSSFLSPKQHGFRKFCSTITNVLELTTMINESFRDRLQTDVVYTDFSKAFDKINLTLLLYKLHRMGFSDLMVPWFESYLTNRTQYYQLVVSLKIVVVQLHYQYTILNRVVPKSNIQDLWVGNAVRIGV